MAPTGDMTGKEAGPSHAASDGGFPLVPGHFAVLRRRYRYVVLQVSSVTAKQFKAPGEWSSREHTYQRGDVIFAGEEADAKLLTERLKSSDALCANEKRLADERCEKRNADLIAKARGASHA